MLRVVCNNQEGLVVCSDACTCTCHPVEEEPKEEGIVAWQPLLGSLDQFIKGLSLGNGGLLLTVAPNALNNILALFAVETLFPGDMDIYLEAQFYESLKDAYILLNVGFDIPDNPEPGVTGHYNTSLKLYNVSGVGYRNDLSRDYLAVEDEDLQAKWKNYIEVLYADYDLFVDNNSGSELPMRDEDGNYLESAFDRLSSSSTVVVRNREGVLMARMPATKSFAGDLRPSKNLDSWINVENLQVKFEGSIEMNVNGGPNDEVKDFDVTDLLADMLYLDEEASDKLGILFDPDGSPSDSADLSLRIDVGLAIDFADPQATELKFEVVKQYTAGGVEYDYLLLGLYYLNRTQSVYLSLPLLDINGIKLGSLDLSGVLDTVVGIDWQTALAADGEEAPGYYGLLAKLFGLDLSIVPDLIEKLQGTGVQGAGLAIALTDTRLGIALNFALVELILRYMDINTETDMGLILDIYENIENRLGLDRLELMIDQGDKVLGEYGLLNELTLSLGLYLDKASDKELGEAMGTTGFEWFGVELSVGNLRVDLGEHGAESALATNTESNLTQKVIVGGAEREEKVQTFLHLPHYNGTGDSYNDRNYVNLNRFGDLTQYPDLLDLSAFHLKLGGDLELNVHQDHVGYSNPAIDFLETLVEDLLENKANVDINRGAKDVWKISFVIEADIDFADWDRTEFKLELLYSRGENSEVKFPLIGLYYWGQSNSFYLDLLNLGLMKTKVQGINFANILQTLTDVDVTQGSLSVGAELLSSLLGSADLTAVVNEWLDAFTEEKTMGSLPEEEPEVEEKPTEEEEEETRLACGCTNPVCVAAGSCKAENGSMLSGEHNCAEMIENAVMTLTMGSYLRGRRDSYAPDVQSPGLQMQLHINTQMVNKLLCILGLDLTLPDQTDVMMEVKINNGFDSVSVTLNSYDVNGKGEVYENAVGDTMANSLRMSLNTFELGYSAGEDMLKGTVYSEYSNVKTELSNFSGLNVGGLIGTNNWSGSLLASLLNSVVDGLYADDLSIKVMTNSTYVGANGTDLNVGKTRSTTLTLSRIASGDFAHGLKLDAGSLLNNVAQLLPNLLGVRELAPSWLEGIYVFEDRVLIDLKITLDIRIFGLGGQVTVYDGNFDVITLDFDAWFGNKAASGETDDKTDLSQGKNEENKEITAADLEEGMADPIRGISVTLGNGNIDDYGYINTEHNGPQYSSIRIDLNPSLVGGLLAKVPELLSSFMTVDSQDNSYLLYAVYQGLKGMLINIENDTIANLVDSMIDSTVGKFVVELLAAVLPFPTVTAGSECSLTVVLSDTVSGGQACLVDRILVRVYTPYTGEYWQVLIDNNGINLSNVDTTKGDAAVSFEEDDVSDTSPVFGNTRTRTIVDVFNLDHDRNGVVDYMEALPTVATVHYWDPASVPSGSASEEYKNVQASWSDGVFKIDPTKYVGQIEDGEELGVYYIEGYVLNYVKKVRVEVPATAARLVKYDERVDSKTGEIIRTPLISGANLSFPLVLEAYEVEDFIASLPQKIEVTFTDGNGDGNFTKTFDGTEGVSRHRVEWDASDLLDSYEGGRYMLHLTFGDGIVGDYHVDIPVVVNANRLTGVRFLAGDGSYEQSTSSLVFGPYDEIRLPKQVWATFGNATPRLYNIRWNADESSLVPVYTGVHYFVDAQIGNLEVGYYDYKNIKIEITSQVIEDYRMMNEAGELVVPDLTFDPYHVSEGYDVVDSKNVQMYPRYLYLKFSGSNEYVKTRVEWALDSVVNTYKGGATVAKFRITSDDEDVLDRMQVAGRQVLDATVNILDATIEGVPTMPTLASYIDPMYLLYVKYEDGEIVDYIEYQEGSTRLVGRMSGVVFDLNKAGFDYSLLEGYEPGLYVYDKQNHKIVDPTDGTDENCYPRRVEVVYRDGTKAVFEAIVDGGTFDLEGGVIWDTKAVSVDYRGGVFMAKLTLGSEQGGYQTVEVPINIADRTVAEVNLANVRPDYVFDPYAVEEYALSEWLYPTNEMDLADFLQSPLSSRGKVIFASSPAGYYPIEWDLSAIDTSYEGGTYQATAKIGGGEAGYQYVSFEVTIERKVIKTVYVPAFVFDPYGNVNAMDVNAEVSGERVYPNEVNVRFEDDSTMVFRSGEFTVETPAGTVVQNFNGVKWDLSALSSKWNSTGGETEVLVKLGNALGGYQQVSIQATVQNRTIDSLRINADETFYFDPYGIVNTKDGNTYLATDPRHVSSYGRTVYEYNSNGDVVGQHQEVDVVYVDGTTATCRVDWNINSIINGYMGYKSRSADGLWMEYEIAAGIGNEWVGYQQHTVKVRIVNREVESLIPTQLTIDPYATETLPQSVRVRFVDGTEGTMSVEWTNKTYDMYVLGREVDNSHATVDARVGNALGGYQIVTVPVVVLDKTIDYVMSGNEIIAMLDPVSGEMVTHGFSYTVGGVEFFREDSCYEIDPLDGAARMMLTSRNVATGEISYVRLELPKVVVAHFAEDNTTRNLNASWDLSHIVGADYRGKTFYSQLGGEQGAILAMGTAKVGYVHLEYKATVINRTVARDENNLPLIYTEDGERLRYIVDDDFDSSSYPNVLTFEFVRDGGYHGGEKVMMTVIWTKESKQAYFSLGNVAFGTQVFRFPVYHVSRNIRYDGQLAGESARLAALAERILALGADEIAQKVVEIAEGSLGLHEYVAVMNALYELRVEESLQDAYANVLEEAEAIKYAMLRIIKIDPYNVVLPEVLNIYVGRAMVDGVEVGRDLCGCTECVGDKCEDSCDCWCTGSVRSMTVDWSKTQIDYNYASAGRTQFIQDVYVNVGSSTQGADRAEGRYVGVYVEIEERYIMAVEKAEFEIDPYDTAALPTEIEVLYQNKMGSGTLEVIANIANARKVTAEMVEDVNSIVYGHAEYINNNTYFYQGGYYVLTVKVGDRVGGYQDVDMLLNVLDRTIARVGDKYLQNGVFTQEITPYLGADGATKQPDGRIEVVYTDGKTGELNVLWNYANINYHYLGNEVTSYVLVGNTMGGYQTIPVLIKVNRMVADASGAVAMTKDAAGALVEFTYNPYLESGMMPDYVKVYFNGEDTTSVLFAVNESNFRLLDVAADYTTQEVHASVRVGNDRSGYQWVDVAIAVRDVLISHIADLRLEVNPYTAALTVVEKDGVRLLYLGGQPLTVDTYLAGQGPVRLAVALAEGEELVYDYNGTDGFVAVRVLVGNAMGGYQEVTAEGLPMQIYYHVNRQLFEKALVAEEFRAVMGADGSINPYDLPALEGKTVAVSLDGRSVQMRVARVEYLDSDGNVLDQLGFAAKQVTVRVIVGNDIGGYQPVEVEGLGVLSLSSVEITDREGLAAAFATWVNPYEYSLPKTVELGGIVYDVRYVTEEGAEFDDSAITYAGGSFAIEARLGNDCVGYQVYAYRLNVRQQLISSVDVGTLSIDPLKGEVALPSGEVTVGMKDGSVRTFVLDAYTAVMVASGADRFVFAEPVLGSESTGGWDLSGVDLSFVGGRYYAILYVGNELGGYQPVAVGVDVPVKILDEKAPVRYVVNKVGGNTELALLSDLVVGVGEYFALPSQLWLTMVDGTAMVTDVVWDSLSYTDEKGTHTVKGWKPADLYEGENVYRTYTVSAEVFGQTVSVKVSVVAERVVLGDSLADYYSVRRGSSFGLPTTFSQEVYLVTDSGMLRVETPTYALSWSESPWLAIEDIHHLSATVQAGQLAWSKEITLQVYSANIDGLAAIGEYEQEIAVGDTLVPMDLPELSVWVAYGGHRYTKDIRVAWVPVSHVSKDGEVSLLGYTDEDANNFAITASDVESVYYFRAIVLDSKGRTLTHNGQEILVAVNVVTAGSLQEKVTVHTNATENGEDYIRLVYGEEGYLPYTVTDSGVEVYRVVYTNGMEEWVREPVDGVMVGALPTSAGEYTMTLHVRYVNSTDTVGEEIAVRYVIAKKDISETIIVSNTNQMRVDGEPMYVTAYVSGRLAPVTVTYLLNGEEVAEPNAVGRYVARVTVEGVNYCGVKEVPFDIVEAVWTTFTYFGEDGTATISATIGDGRFVSPDRLGACNMAGEKHISIWYYVKDGVKHHFRLSDKVTVDMATKNESNGRYELRFYEERVSVSFDENGLAVLTFADARGESEPYDGLFGVITINYKESSNELVVLNERYEKGVKVTPDGNLDGISGDYYVVVTVQCGSIKAIIGDSEKGITAHK